MVRCEVHSVYKRVSDKRYVFMVQVSVGRPGMVNATMWCFPYKVLKHYILVCIAVVLCNTCLIVHNK